MLVLALPLVAAGTPPKGAIQVLPQGVEWQPHPRPPGTQIAVLEGDPKKPGLFTLRLRIPGGSRMAPHWHPRDERVTVLSGAVAVGFGDVLDESKVTRFGPGSYYVNPANSHHYVLFAEESVVQVTGIGPWEINFLTPAAPAP